MLSVSASSTGSFVVHLSGQAASTSTTPADSLQRLAAVTDFAGRRLCECHIRIQLRDVPFGHGHVVSQQ
jgi:hypothetical protein